MPDTLDQINAILARSERMLQAQRWIIVLTASAVLWGAKLECTKADHEKRITNVETDTQHIHDDMIEVKTRIHGVASQIGKMPGKVASTIKQE